MSFQLKHDDRLRELIERATIPAEKIGDAIDKWDVEPLGRRMFVCRVAEREVGAEKKIVIAAVYEEASCVGEVIVAGPDACQERETPEVIVGDDGKKQYSFSHFFETGDRVLFARWAGHIIDRHGISLMCMNGDDALGLIRPQGFIRLRKPRAAAPAAKSNGKKKVTNG